MKINKAEPILGLKKVVSTLFNVKFPHFDHSKYPDGLHKALRDLYEIDAYFSKGSNDQTVSFLGRQDRLIPFDALDLTKKMFDFARENQNNWVCEGELKTSKIYFKDRIEPYNSHYLKQKLPDFLMTFALRETVFCLTHHIGLEAKNMTEIEFVFNDVKHLWTAKYLNHTDAFSYYLVDDDCLVMWADTVVFATNNKEKFEHYKGILAHYTF